MCVCARVCVRVCRVPYAQLLLNCPLDCHIVMKLRLVLRM